MAYTVDYSRPCHIHFIGIGGVSMNALAYILLRNGFTISGSDRTPNEQTERLSRLGANIMIGHDASYIDDSIGVVVYNAAIHAGNPEYDKALALGLPMLTRGQLLGQIMSHYPTSIGVSGTHGKTTTTSFLSYILVQARLDPTINNGSELDILDGTLRYGASKLFLAEACEYTNSFLSLYPWMEVILNIEADHLDFFKDIDDIRNSFHTYFTHIPKEGHLVIASGIRQLETLTAGLSCHVTTYGVEDKNADYYAVNLALLPNSACYEFDVCSSREHTALLHARLNVPGLHNVHNATAAITAALLMGISPEVIAKAVGCFHGAARRFEKKGSFHGVTVIDDYAHHPQEIAATLTTAKTCPHRELWCVFQPHTYSRTKLLFDDFVKALSLADHVILTDIYPARETDTLGMSSAYLAEAIRQAGRTDAIYLSTFDDIKKFLWEHCINNDLLISMGAGNIQALPNLLLSADK